MVPPRIFICYAKEDAARAKRLFGELQAAGLDPWMDEKLEGGTQWDSVIQEQVTAADYFLVVHTRRLAEKEFSYVNREIYLGLQRQQFARQGVRFIIPLALDDAPIIADLSHLQAERVPDLEDVSALVSLIKRDYQRRARQVAAS
jgi:hypothetical protein